MRSQSCTPINLRGILIPALLIGFAFAGCSKNTNLSVQKNLYWTPPEDELIIEGEAAPLIIRLSKYPVVYISHIPKNQTLTKVEEEEGVIVMPSGIEDILPRIQAFKQEQEALGNPVAVVIEGDDYTPCGAIIKAIECAKRARIESIFFETGPWPRSGMAFRRIIGGVPIKYFEFPNGITPPWALRKNTITLSISGDEKIAWNGLAITRERWIQKMHDHAIAIGPENAFFVVLVDPDASFPALRDVLDQLRRTGSCKVMISLLKSP